MTHRVWRIVLGAMSSCVCYAGMVIEVSGGAHGLTCRDYFLEHAPRRHEAPILYVAFDKTGSTSLQRTFSDVLKTRYFSPDFRCPPPRWPILWYTWGQYAHFGLSEFTSVKYMTMLRDPLSRLNSAYVYFCAWCSERGRQCGREAPSVLTCPNLTLTQYAHAFADLYTRAFANPYNHVDLHYEVTDVEYGNAISFFETTKPLVLFLEDLTNSERPLRTLAEYTGFPGFANISTFRHENYLHSPKSNNKTAPFIPREDYDGARRFLAWDIRLMAWLRHNYTQPVI